MYPFYSENAAVTCTEQYFTMPDGVRLYTRVTAPKGVDKAPIVFIRTAYEDAHRGVPHDLREYEADQFLRNGFAVVLQHVRGKGDSEGFCVPYREREDGLNTLEQIRKLDIYNGEIYLFGGSYLTSVHLCYLDTNPTDIKGAVLNIQTDRMYFRNYRNGCCYQFCNLKWWFEMMDREYPMPDLDRIAQRPYVDIMRRALGHDLPLYTDLLRNDRYDDFWENDPRTHAIEGLSFPVLFAEGWFDYYIEGMFDMWARLPDATRARSAFVVGPWGHAVTVSDRAEYPLARGNMPADYAAAWFNSIRNGTPYPYAKTGKLNYYSIGKDTWQACAFPPPATGGQRLYFGPQNALQPAPCTAAASLSYDYDPEQRLNCFPFHDIYRAAPIGSVAGVLSFQTEAFSADAGYLGKIRWHMNVSSDCDDTAFFIRVYFVEDGVAYNLTETITSLSHICENYTAGDTVTIDLYTPVIAFTVKKGGCIRVDIASDGGVYVPHANVKGHWAEVAETKTAHNTVHLQDSFIELCRE